MAQRLTEMNAELDVRNALGAIRAPCVVICRTEDAWLSADNSRYLAAHINGARGSPPKRLWAPLRRA
jgi:pimeloyl-ACP methyl ester carboxylesterase